MLRITTVTLSASMGGTTREGEGGEEEEERAWRRRGNSLMPRLCVERKMFCFFLFSLGIRSRKRGEHVGIGEEKGRRPMGGKSLRATKREEQGSLRREKEGMVGRNISMKLNPCFILQVQQADWFSWSRG